MVDHKEIVELAKQYAPQLAKGDSTLMGDIADLIKKYKSYSGMLGIPESKVDELLTLLSDQSLNGKYSIEAIAASAPEVAQVVTILMNQKGK